MQVSLSNHSRTQTANLMMSYSRDVGVAPTVGAMPTSRLTKTYNQRHPCSMIEVNGDRVSYRSFGFQRLACFSQHLELGFG